MSDFTTYVIFIGSNIVNVFNMLDSVDVWDSGITYLDALLSILYIEIIIWFIQALLHMDSDDDEEDESNSPTPGTASSGEGDF